MTETPTLTRAERRALDRLFAEDKAGPNEHAIDRVRAYKQHQARVGPAVRKLRIEHGWTLREFSEWADIDKGQLSRLENGEAGVSYGKALVIAEMLGVPLVRLLR